MSIKELVANLKNIVPKISVEKLAADTSSLRIIDCRELEEVELGMIPSSEWLAKGKADLQIEKNVPDKSSPIVVYCASGFRSVLVAKSFIDLGYTDVRTLDGGIEAWKNSGRPISLFKSTKVNSKRYKAQIALPEVGEAGQAILQNAKVLIVGAGGLGSPTSLYLAAAGVGTIGIADDDSVDESNLQRQILHSTDRIGLKKVESAFLTLKGLNPNANVKMHQLRVKSDNIDELIKPYDVIIDGCDNFQTRYLVNQACLKHGKVNIHGSVFGFQGQVSVFCSQDGPCYRCLFPEPPDGDLAPNCAEGGVLGAVVGVVGSLVAVEALKWILQIKPLKKSLLCYDGLNSSFDVLEIKKDPTCPSCSLPKDKLDYELNFNHVQFCEKK